MELEKYSLGIGDRFGYQCAPQLRAVQKAAEKGSRFSDMLREARGIIEENVTGNLYEKHIVPLFMGC
jgi:hypothetical protein